MFRSSSIRAKQRERERDYKTINDNDDSGEERNRHRGSAEEAFKKEKRSACLLLSLLSHERLQRLQRLPRSSLTRRGCHARVFAPSPFSAWRRGGPRNAETTSLTGPVHPDLRRASSVCGYFLLHARFSPPLDSIRNTLL